MKISFEREGAALKLKVSIVVPGHNSVTYTGSCELDNEFYAGFVQAAIRDQFGDRIMEIRKEAYDEGWKSAKAKRGAKQQWFSRWL